ncbi:ubiquinol-cytochrome C chaperone family protein [Zavarzinia compransoris]|uniref:Ubiquinol-cytochrome C chaperone n=1 Tax=Zavarzinia compransoris TaxID=1264899 RepID=A0A317E9W9_9PROT|nr:ubiquinol-cytochrome C chaperone family protein [Zavarzinia compransoris]PWR23719.1 ubiquinol-cytochrome C chaperone [Zavarzinia compransoris]TDP47943.1 cytochrome b pre-mRNA-processing protein 3 [Zavarzinia compransoris]
MLHKLFNRQDQRIAATLYAAAVSRARTPVFYRQFRVADSMDGRFDMVTLEVVVLLNRFKGETDKRVRRLSQGIFDMMFTDMDRTLRELGVGDQGVPHRVKKMAQAFYGRLGAYDNALAAGDDVALTEALKRNLYRGAEIAPDILAGFAAYVRGLAAFYAAAPLDGFHAGQLPPAPLPEE